MERSGAISPGILVLTTGLSKPFRRLDKYSAMLQELERYTEKNHPDRGDTQRSIVVYREIAVSHSISTFFASLNFLLMLVFSLYDVRCLCRISCRIDVHPYENNASWRFKF